MTVNCPPRRRSLGLAALSGLLLVGAFPHLDWGWLAWVGLVPFLSTFPHRRMRGALAAGGVLGLVYFGGVWYWMAVFAGHVIGRPLGVVVWVGAALAQTATLLVVAAGAQVLSRRPGVWPWRLGVPALWTVGEWARQFGPLGTGWSDLAYTQHAYLLPLQLTKLTGVFGLSFLIVLVNVAVCTVKPVATGPSPIPMGAGVPKAGWGSWGLAVAALVLLVLAYGAVALHTERLRPTFAAAALQADINEDVPWNGSRPADPAYVRRVMDTYAAQAREASLHGARLVVWPETGFPGLLRTDPELRGEAAAQAVSNRQAMLVGSVDYDLAAQKSANTLFLIDAQGNLVGGYRKQRLVPFGEYIPLRKWLPFLDALHLSVYDMTPGGPASRCWTPARPWANSARPSATTPVTGRSCAAKWRRARTCWSWRPTTPGSGAPPPPASTPPWPPSAPPRTTATWSAAPPRAFPRSSPRRGKF